MKYRTKKKFRVQKEVENYKLYLDEIAMHHPNNLEILGKPTPPHQSQTILATAPKPYPFTWQKLGSFRKWRQEKGRVESTQK